MTGKQLIKPLWARLFGVRCPICGWRGVRFSSNNRRPNSKCEGCGSLERHRMFWTFLARRLAMEDRPPRMLHLAPEPFLASRLRALSDIYVSLDVDTDRPGTDVTADITRLPFADSVFDAVVCSHVLEHVRDDATAMSELRRVLRRGGWMIADVPLNLAEDATLEDPEADERTRIEVYKQIDHLRLYGSTDYIARLTAAGFEVTRPTGQQVAGRSSRRKGVTANRVMHICS